MTEKEALKLALEALKYPLNQSHENFNVDMAELLAHRAITAIKQARSAPAQEPVAFNAGVPPLYPEMKDGETISVEYTTPPAAQRPVAEPHKWVGLTPREIYNLWEDSGVPFVDWDSFASITRAIEAKLKEKNGWYRQHVIDGSPCWCEPEISYTNPETGASVIVHKEPQ